MLLVVEKNPRLEKYPSIQSLRVITCFLWKYRQREWKGVSLVSLESIESLEENSRLSWRVCVNCVTEVGIVGCAKCLVPFTDSIIVMPSHSLKLNSWFFSLLGFPLKSLCSFLLLHYSLCDCFLLPSRTRSWSGVNFYANKWYQSEVVVFYMAEEKSTIGGVKVELKPFDGRSNFTLWPRKMKNILI